MYILDYIKFFFAWLYFTFVGCKVVAIWWLIRHGVRVPDLEELGYHALRGREIQEAIEQNHNKKKGTNH